MSGQSGNAAGASRTARPNGAGRPGCQSPANRLGWRADRQAGRPPPPNTVSPDFILAVRNRHRCRRVEARVLRQIIRWLLKEQFQAASVEVCFHLVGAKEMAEVNWRFLRHEGSTDVITFDCSDDDLLGGATSLSPHPPACGDKNVAAPRRSEAKATFHGEIYISLDDAVAQAKEFRTTWQSELARYVIHGLLHLAGYDDLQPAARRVMKREENRLLKETGARFRLASLRRLPSRH